MSASIFGDFLILWLQVEDGVSFLVPVLDEIRLDAGLQERAGPERGRVSYSRQGFPSSGGGRSRV